MNKLTIQTKLSEWMNTINEIIDSIQTFIGCTSSKEGKSGLVPKPNSGDQNKFLKGDGTWDNIIDTKVTQTVTTTNADYPILASATADLTSTSTTTARFDSGITLNPGTNTITAGTFKGALSGNASTATKANQLTTARTIRTNLASTSTASFNGTANITPGVTGILPVANGGTGASTSSAVRTNLDVPPTNHASSNTTYGVGTDSDYGHVRSDGTTTKIVSGEIVVKDIAVGGDTSDLASARGQIGGCQNLLDPDFHTILKSGVWRVSGSNQKNAPGDSSLNAILISNATKDGAYCSHIYIRTLESNAIWVETYHANEGWQPWRRVILDANIGDGITVNNGIISVPEYEGATASAAATSGLVPPATSLETESALCGDGTFRAFLQLAGGTMTGGLFGTAVALSGSVIDVSIGSCFAKVITASTTFTITGAPSGAVGCFSLILTDGGSQTVTWPSSVKWTEGTPPELASSGIDVITFLTADGGTTWYGVHSVQGAA